MEAEALGQNYDAAVSRAENVLLPAFDSWRTRGLSDLAPIGVTRGSFDWLVQGFKQQQKYKDVDAHTKRTYDNGTQLFAPVNIPVNFVGNAIGVAGEANAAGAGSNWTEGGWGGVQPGLYRVDAGPRLTMQVRRNVRVHLDYRQRLAGNAEPGSGPTLTLAGDF